VSCGNAVRLRDLIESKYALVGAFAKVFRAALTETIPYPTRIASFWVEVSDRA